MPTKSEFTLIEVAALAGVPVRTIRYYMGQGLLPAPGRDGPATRYDAAFLARLEVIKRLRDQHLPLAAIRTELAVRTDEDVIAMTSQPEPEPTDSALDYVRSLLGRPASPGSPASPA